FDDIMQRFQTVKNSFTLIALYRPRLSLHSFPTRRSSDLLPRDKRGGPARDARGPLPAQLRLAGHPRAGSRAAPGAADAVLGRARSEEHTSELQSRENLVCRLLLEK